MKIRRKELKNRVRIRRKWWRKNVPRANCLKSLIHKGFIGEERMVCAGESSLECASAQNLQGRKAYEHKS